MAKQQHLDILKLGVDVWNKWRREHPEIQPDLSGASLSNVNLSSVNLIGADLHGIDLCGATLRKARLRRANLSFAYLRQADLGDADLSRANLSGANFTGANLHRTDLSEANLDGVNLTRAILVETDLMGANLTNCWLYGIATWDVELEGAKQSNLIITHPSEPTITVDNLEVAQFIYLLLNNTKIRDVLNSVMKRGVLLLGRFSDSGLDLLHSIASRLREMQYLPIIFDFDRPDSRNFTETVKTLVGISRFVIVDLSGPSVPQELYATIPHFKIPFVPIIEADRKTYSMFPDLLEYPWVVKPVVEFSSQEHLMELLPSKVIEPAEEKFKERQALLQQLFPR